MEWISWNTGQQGPSSSINCQSPGGHGYCDGQQSQSSNQNISDSQRPMALIS